MINNSVIEDWLSFLSIVMDKEDTDLVRLLYTKTEELTASNDYEKAILHSWLAERDKDKGISNMLSQNAGAITYFERFLKHSPNCERTKLSLVNSYLQRGKLSLTEEERMSSFRKAVSLCEDILGENRYSLSAYICIHKGYLLLSKELITRNRFSEALKYYHAADYHACLAKAYCNYNLI